MTPTHHAVVQGTVVGADGVGLASIGVGVRFASASPTDRQVNVEGGGTTNANSGYSFEVKSTAPRSADAMGDLFILASKPAPPGGQVVQDSVIVTIPFVRLADPAVTSAVPQIKLLN